MNGQLHIERWSPEEACPDGGWWAVLDRCDDHAGPYPPVALFRRKPDAEAYINAYHVDDPETPLAYDACVTPAAILDAKPALVSVSTHNYPCPLSKPGTVRRLIDAGQPLDRACTCKETTAPSALKPTPPEADPPAMTEPLSAQVADHMRKLTAKLREAQRRIADLEAGMRRMQDEAAARGVEIAIPTPSASS